MSNTGGYRDYSLEEENDDEGMENRMRIEHHNNSEDERLNRLRVQAREGAFALRLHHVLREVEREGKTHIVSWLPHGRAIQVHNKKLFEQEILPNWFQQTKVESFHRQLNHYGFKRLVHGPDKNAYYHELFLKGRPDLAQRMVRTKIKGTARRRPTLPENEPDLWAMPRMGTMSVTLSKNTSHALTAAATPRPCTSAERAVPLQQQQRAQTAEALPAPDIQVSGDPTVHHDPARFRAPTQEVLPAFAVNAAMINEMVAVPTYFAPWNPIVMFYMPGVFATSAGVMVPTLFPQSFLPTTGIVDNNNNNNNSKSSPNVASEPN